MEVNGGRACKPLRVVFSLWKECINGLDIWETLHAKFGNEATNELIKILVILLGAVPNIPLMDVSNSRIGGDLSAPRTGNVIDSIRVEVSASLWEKLFVDVTRWEISLQPALRVMVIKVHKLVAFCDKLDPVTVSVFGNPRDEVVCWDPVTSTAEDGDVVDLEKEAGAGLPIKLSLNKLEFAKANSFRNGINFVVTMEKSCLDGVSRDRMQSRAVSIPGDVLVVRMLFSQLPASQVGSVETDVKLILAIFLEMLRDIHTLWNKHVLCFENLLAIQFDNSKSVEAVKGQYGLFAITDLGARKCSLVDPDSLSDPLNLQLIFPDVRIRNLFVVKQIEMNVVRGAMLESSLTEVVRKVL
ncbi:hypothetical protein HG531_001920 [Fusarium graminearum]|nr:hypothetical protein HG531_001920 [Fusarium graminearum]